MCLRRIHLILIALLCIQITDLANASGSDLSPDEPTKAEIQRYKQLALNGDARAQFKMGTYYLQVGDGIVSAQNLALAEKWFRRSAQQGHLSAMLGLAYVLNKKAKTVEDEVEIA
jgi:TPR repeat protein